MNDAQFLALNGPATIATAWPVKMPNMKERLELAVAQAEERLAAAKEAREIFSRNPDIERLLNIMQKGLF